MNSFSVAIQCYHNPETAERPTILCRKNVLNLTSSSNNQVNVPKVSFVNFQVKLPHAVWEKFIVQWFVDI